MKFFANKWYTNRCAKNVLFCFVFLANFALLAGFFWSPILDTRISIQTLSSSSVTLWVPLWNLKRLDWRALVESRPLNIEEKKLRGLHFFWQKKVFQNFQIFWRKKVICSDFSRFYQFFFLRIGLNWRDLV